MHFVSVMFASPAYDEMVQLRLENLYTPLGAEIDIELLATEYKDKHWGVYDDNAHLVGAVLAEDKPEEDNKITVLKQVVIQTKMQKRGFGKKLMISLEEFLQKEGGEIIHVNAHKKAFAFYKKLGYTKQGDKFFTNGIQQQLMTKKLTK